MSAWSSSLALAHTFLFLPPTGPMVIDAGELVAGSWPTFDELAWARRVCDAMAASGNAAVAINGKMVDAPVLRLAERLLAMES